MLAYILAPSSGWPTAGVTGLTAAAAAVSGIMDQQQRSKDLAAVQASYEKTLQLWQQHAALPRFAALLCRVAGQLETALNA